MANVQLPQIGISNTQIDEAGMDGLKQHVKSLLNVTVMLTEELTYLLNNLDTRNVNELNADIINAGTINANLVKIMSELSNGGYISFDGEGMKVNDGTRDTMTIGLDGKPRMSGAYIESAEGYPKVVMDPDGNLFRAYLDANNYIGIEADYAGSPSMTLVNGGVIKARFSTLLGTLLVDAVGGMEINVTGGGSLGLPRFSDIVGRNGSNLGVELDNKALAGISTNASGGHNHGIPDGTVLRTADGGTVTFSAAPQHTHQQTN
ncbi:hypothetical protein [Paenibacillus sp. PDC88]|uniref:hypothetical protein n=1 Tax=Paenibacillus sp. PDC88 TaxID=1884375 RepID=UPI00089B6B10|nr:hypothetical protein [Paenibacillus sp. PDC88]SDX05570.1 hypothetical protein SAMN05518848_104218 [Paenibacillus sp. PDC88]